MKHAELTRFPTDGELAHAVAAEWLREIETASRSGAPLYAALSGGRIARKLFSAVAQQVGVASRTLNSVHFFWADERCVTEHDPESNYCVAREFLFKPLRIPDEMIHRIRGEEPPDLAAAEAEAEICRMAPISADGQPVLGLILLGMGEDGHVASLFPGELESAMSNPAVYRAVTAAKPPPQRITIGYKTIARARQVWVLASGPGKAAALRDSLVSGGKTPLARVIESRTSTRIFADFEIG